MTVTTYQGWLADGSPWHASNPAHYLSAACTAHGVTYGILGNLAHLTATTPQDHCPYSHTPWPLPQPYPAVMAIDLMTTDPKVARRIIEAKRSGRLPCLKYINWTDEAGNTWHTSWEPTESTTSSSDTGHIHCSMRTDHVVCNHAQGFDPFIEEDFMATISQDSWDALIWRVEGIAAGRETVEGGPTKGKPIQLNVDLHQAQRDIQTLATAVVTLRAAVEAIQAGAVEGTATVTVDLHSAT